VCLVALALEAHPRFPVVIAANRDEFHARPTAALDWWRPEGARAEVLSGRDLQAGGTWMGLTRGGRLALLTNVRDPAAHDPASPSRGRIVTDWLADDDAVEPFWSRLAAQRHNGFNLVFGALAFGRATAPGLFWASNVGVTPQALGTGVHALSNAALETPWPKQLVLRTGLAAALEGAIAVDRLVADLLAALGDRTPAADERLPDTGVPRDVERALSSAFVAMPERGYGTRSSTILVTERTGSAPRTLVVEQSFGPDGAPAGAARTVVLDDWPPVRDRGAPAAP
jgi:uncharacterized protein with NRDE domain